MAEHDNLQVDEAAPDEVGVESDQSDQVVAGDNIVNNDNTDNTSDDTNNEVESAVQSSEQTSNTAR